ncbi:MAG: ABC transporter substrate-binding protein [Chromatiales bacterium]|nr:ABC transporter substrate-binding protein [Chromatiales bacterium]
MPISKSHSTPAASGNRELFKTVGSVIVLAVLGFWLAYQFVDPAPPREVTFAAGAPDGAYALYAERYKEILARHGIQLRVIHTQGSVENLDLLQEGRAAVALVQGGVKAPPDSAVVSLGSVYYEPLWVFHRMGDGLRSLVGLAGKRVNIGLDGSGTHAVALDLLAANAVSQTNTTLTNLGGPEAVEALSAGSLDAAMFIAGPDSPLIRTLLLRDDLRLLNFQRAEAYVRRFRYLSRLTLPAGVVDLGRDVPPRNTELLAPTANLAAGPELHPALIDLFLQAAAEVHGQGGLFAAPGDFPKPEFLAFPLHKEAQRYYRSGPPFLQRYLPFWAASLMDRLKVMLLPLVALLIPLVKFMPPLYRWRMRSRIYRWYREIQAVDLAIGPQRTVEENETLAEELDRIKDDILKVQVPLAFADELYQLRVHAELVQRRLRVAATQD